MESRLETRSWVTVRPESKEGSDRSDTARERRDGGTQSEADDRIANQRGPRPVSVEPAVQLATSPEGWTVFLNASRQVLYGHVRTGMLCFQVPENPEVLNSLVF